MLNLILLRSKLIHVRSTEAKKYVECEADETINLILVKLINSFIVERKGLKCQLTVKVTGY